MDPTHPNATRIDRFYRALDRGDAPTMVASYAPDATFADPAFGELRGEEVGAMWTMLCSQATDLDVEASGIAADAQSGRAHWDATYTFTATGRPVVNRIDATFRFDADGLIAEHRDRFSMWRWSLQALGAPALVLGWNPVGRQVIRGRARGRLEQFMARPRDAGA